MSTSRGPRVSIALPTFNGEPFIDAQVESLLDQDFEDFELVIADNASTDGTLAIAERFAEKDDRVRVLTSDVNRGAAWNYNRCVDETTGEYFKWVADDDVHAPTYLSRCVEALDDDPGVVLAHTQTVDIDASGAVCKQYGAVRFGTEPTPSERFRHLILDIHDCFEAFAVIRRAALAETTLIAPYVASDEVMLAQLALRGRWAQIPEDLFLHREHPGRSIRAVKREKGRTAWFDTSKSDAIVLPKWRRLVEYEKSVRNAPISAGERRRALAALGPWTWRNRVGLAANLASAGRAHAQRVTGRS